MPGGCPTDRPSLEPEPSQPAPPHQIGSLASIPGTPGRGPLVEYAFGLLALVPLLRAYTPPAPPEQLRIHIESELCIFTERAQASGLDQKLVFVGHYTLCAFFDDVVLNTPWGAHSMWRSNTLAAALHHDAGTGEQFFSYLEQASIQPERHRPVLELMFACLALGFEGRYRLIPHGRSALQRIHADIFSVLRRLDGADEGVLSPHWRGADTPSMPIVRQIPLWVFVSATLALIVLVYTALSIRLGGDGERLDAIVSSLPPAGPISIVRQAPATLLVPLVPRTLTIEPQLRGCLPESMRAQPDTVFEGLQGLRIRLASAGLFASGRAELQPTVEPLIACLATILKDTEGKIEVVGHTDNIPIRTVRFSNNWELSRARAEAVAAVIRPILRTASLHVAGRADSEPVASNTTEDGRNRNRRVEILVLQ
ncbi:type IVB secretion system protein IcmH/DotU [Dankookia rubra]|nr:type IVB secretion system protein IcmH/DotU [Dankookia rubra]